jgi:hypothetical protein
MSVAPKWWADQSASCMEVFVSILTGDAKRRTVRALSPPGRNPGSSDFARKEANHAEIDFAASKR